MPAPSVADQVIEAARELRNAVDRLKFKPPVTHVYNPLDYAWPVHQAYLQRYADGRRRVVFLGMNPGPFGMVQTGVPFGEIAAVRDWMRIEMPVGRPGHEHSKRPVDGFACQRSEVSGRRLWDLFAGRFGTAERFFGGCFVANYCPLAFLDRTGRNVTPDKLPAPQAAALFAACDHHLRRVADVLQPEWLIGIGDFAGKRARYVFADAPLKVGKILHPSPASPSANKDWAGTATAQLKALGVW